MYLILTAFFGMLMCCDVKVEPKQANASELFYAGMNCSIMFNKFNYGGMEYGIFYSTHNGSMSGNGVFAVNFTKDKLEVEKLKLEIEKIKMEKTNQ